MTLHVIVVERASTIFGKRIYLFVDPHHEYDPPDQEQEQEPEPVLGYQMHFQVPRHGEATSTSERFATTLIQIR